MGLACLTLKPCLNMSETHTKAKRHPWAHRYALREARLCTATLRFYPELPISLGQAWHPQCLSKDLAEGTPHAPSFWPREKSLLLHCQPLRPQGLPRTPCPAKATPLQVSPSSTILALTFLSASSQGGNKITCVLTNSSSYLSGEHPASLCPLQWAALHCGEHLLWGCSPTSPQSQDRDSPPQANLLHLGQKEARWGLLPASHPVHQSAPHLAQSTAEAHHYHC